MPSSADDGPDRRVQMIGAYSALMNLVIFTAVGALAIENVAYGAIVGIFGAVGSYLFIPWFLTLTAAQEEADEDIPLTTAADQITQSIQLGTAGLGLESGAIVMLAVGFSVGPEFILGIASALVVTLSMYLVGSLLLSR